MFTPRDIIKEVAAPLVVGDKVRIICPFCNTQHEKSCAISVKEDGIFYVCPRAKCKAAGVIHTVRSALSTITKGFTPRYYYGSFRHLPEHILDFLDTNYGINMLSHSEHLQRMRYDDSTNRLVILVPGMDSPRGIVGYYAKKLPVDLADKDSLDYELYKNLQKGDIYKYKDALFVYPSSLPQVLGSEVVCLVEDALSAVKLGSVLPTIALMSTALPNDLLQHIKHVKHVVIALDPDATKIAWAMRKKISILFDQVDVVVLATDPKDTSYEVLQKTFTEYL